MCDLRARLAMAPQITTDGFSPYIEAIARSFGGPVNYLMCKGTSAENTLVLGVILSSILRLLARVGLQSNPLLEPGMGHPLQPEPKVSPHAERTQKRRCHAAARAVEPVVSKDMIAR